MKDILVKLLQRVLDDIDSGNSTLTEDEEVEVIRVLRRYTRKDMRMSKAQACGYLGISRSTFDALVHDGEIPRGRKQTGFKELSWTRRDLDGYISKKQQIKNT